MTALNSSDPSAKNPSGSSATDEWIQQSVASIRGEVGRYVAAATDYPKQYPRKALGIALAAGYLLRMLPVAGILGVIIRLAFRLVKPALVAYAGSKVWEKLHPSNPSEPGPAHGPQ